MAWLARQRAEKAAVLLLTTDKAIAAIGREVGWHDPNYFARRFRAAFGISARQYRNQLPCPALVKTADAWIQW
jgi:AraC family L-rhamnose operon transcriptional activator RhaR